MRDDSAWGREVWWWRNKPWAALIAGSYGGSATSHERRCEVWAVHGAAALRARRSDGGTWNRRPVRDGMWSGEAWCAGSCGRCRWRGDGVGKRSEAAVGGLEEGERERAS